MSNVEVLEPVERRDPFFFSIAQRLPFDILEIVFKETLRDHAHCNNDSASATSIFRLCHICVAWRYAALRMRSMWSSNMFYIHNTNGRENNLYLHPTATNFICWWNEHLKHVPPSIAFTRDSRHETESPLSTASIHQDAFTTFFSGLFFRSARTLALTLNITELANISDELAPFHNLQEMMFQLLDCPAGPTDRVFTFPPAPLLTRLHFSCPVDFEWYILGVFPWAQLTHLFVDTEIPHDMWKAILKSTTNLIVAGIHIDPLFLSSTGGPLPADEIVTCHLRHLSVMSRFLDASLYLPNLTALRIIEADGGMPILYIEEVEYHLRAAPRLTELHIDHSLAFDNVHCILFGTPEESGLGLAKLVPHLRLFLLHSICPLGGNSGKNIIRLLESSWLNGGWPARASDGSRLRRQLKLGVNFRSFAADTLSSGTRVINEVQEYLTARWPADSPFEVSVQSTDELRSQYGRPQHGDIFDTSYGNRGWGYALNFEDRL